jgi:hypothetical protein
MAIKDPRFVPKKVEDERKANPIVGKEIRNDTILTNHIANQSITSEKLANGSITPDKLSSNWPSFYALSSGANKNTVSNGILIFDGGVRFNNGNHYSTTTYRFTAPYTGLYYFWVGYFNNANTGPERISLAIDGTMLNHPYLLAPSNVVGSAHMGGLSIVINQGQLVDVRSQYGTGIYYGGHTAWGGYLIR